MSSLQDAKNALLGFAESHDVQKAAQRKPMKALLLAAGVVFIGSRLLFGGRREAKGVRRGRGGRLMGTLVALRLALRFGPVIAHALRTGRAAWEAQRRQRASMGPVVVRPVEARPLPVSSSTIT